ncbi:TXK kinase, partial [Tachuris rubrigastra]|nr:TXK kinase [Tachuris rubrigastra]
MFLFTDHTIQSVFCCCCCCTVQESRAMRTKVSLDPDTGLVTHYSASQPDVSYAPTWKCRRKKQLKFKNKPLPPLPAEALEDYNKKPRVIALYDFFARGPSDLPLKKSEEYIILEQYDPHWWKARDQHGNEGLIPSNCVTENKKSNLEMYKWYCKNINRRQAELLLYQKVTQLVH